MANLRPITIVGGGLAGLTLGISLRQDGVPITPVEAARYPRHRVCGEFLSGRGQEVLEGLGLLPQMQAAGLRIGETAAFYSQEKTFPVRKLPSSAWCLSRLRLDALLAEKFRNLGGSLQENTRWRHRYGESVIRATGRRISKMEKGWRWFGLKVHARNVRLDADLEMHLTDSGYVGLCRIEEDRINICGLFRSAQTQPELAQHWKRWLCGSPHSALFHKLSSADFDPASFCSVAGLSLRTDRGRDRTECSLGDAITMIPPVTGNGMSMALESAALARSPILDFARGDLSWPEATRHVAQACDVRFEKRLQWSSWLHNGLFKPALGGRLIQLGATWEFAWNWMFSKTRS